MPVSILCTQCNCMLAHWLKCSLRDAAIVFASVKTTVDEMTPHFAQVTQNPSGNPPGSSWTLKRGKLRMWLCLFFCRCWECRCKKTEGTLCWCISCILCRQGCPAFLVKQEYNDSGENLFMHCIVSVLWIKGTWPAKVCTLASLCGDEDVKGPICMR